jgi:hypothetical protein
MLELRPDGVATSETKAGLDAVGLDAGQTHAPAAAASAPPVCRTVVEPLSPGRYKVQFMASAELRNKLEKLIALMGSQAPQGDLAAVIEQAVTEKLERLEARRFGTTRAHRKGSAETEEAEAGPSPSSRHIPAAVQRAVRERDGNRCRYVDDKGRRCPERKRNRLQFHHRHPFGLGGDHSVLNIRLMCRAHNDYLAACDYGREAMARHRRPRSRASQPAAG